MINTKEVDRSLGCLLSVAAAATGLVDNIKYAHTLRLRFSELRRYFKKTVDLGMCYAGFAQNFSLDQAKGAGHAAFLSCAFDAVTDWGKPADLQASYARILHSEASPELTEMALGLLDRDVNGILLYDGLERGVIATEFVLQMMGVREIFDRKCDIKQLGIDLQIVDDVLDYKDDMSKGDQNCLTNTKLRAAYLRRLQDDFDDPTLQKLFPYGAVLTYAIRHAKDEANNMLTFPEKYFKRTP